MKSATPSGEELYAQGRRALERGDEAAAETALVEALAAKPNLHYAREDLGNLRVRQGRLDAAESALRDGLERNPSWVGYRRLAARVDLASDRPAAAVEVLLRDPPPVERDVDYHALMASAYQRLGRHEEASRGYRELLRVQPDEANWWAGYGLSRDALDDAAGALAAYARARQLGGLDPRVLEHIDRRAAALQAAG
ncbi:MAG: tetratricopeptide repeat protein [Nevskiaceae bacterium]